MNNNFDIDSLINLRHQLHQNAELSNQELNTAKIIKDYVSTFSPDTVIENVGGHGLIFEFKGSNSKGLAIGFRADIDALPIDETIQLSYGSIKKGVSHKCGHDGHTTMVAAIAHLASTKKLRNTIYLVFQPAEEIGTGAEAVVQNLQKNNIKLDYLFGLHNLPGFKAGQIITRKGTFAPASTGMIITLKGKTSHAAEPENGISPAVAFSKIIRRLQQLDQSVKSEELILCTVVQAELGEIAFGTSPAYAEIRATFRANRDADLAQLLEIAEQIVKTEAKEQKLTHSISYTESFPSTVNSLEAFSIMERVANEANFSFQNKTVPFKWSEDFGHYKSITESVFFGLGAGEDCPMLHNEAYDFPDAILKDGIQMYTGIIQLLENKND